MRYKPLSGKRSDHRCCRVISDFPRLADVDVTREIARVELRSKWPAAIVDGLNPSSMRET